MEYQKYPEKDDIFSVDNERFERARLEAESSVREGIGTLSEKLIHATLKNYLEHRKSLQEVPYLGSVADVKNECGVLEIQTRSLIRLSSKLEKFLPESPVTLVYPILREKLISRMDVKTGDVTSPRKSPRRGEGWDILPELSGLSKFFGDKNLSVKIAFINAHEVTKLPEDGIRHRRVSYKLYITPTELVSFVDASTRESIIKLLPESLPDRFTAKDFERCTKLRGRRGYFSLKFLLEIGALEREAEGRKYIYKIKKQYLI